MGTMQRVAVCLLLTIVPLAGCGDDTAAVGTTVVAPGDLTATYTNSSGGIDQTAAPLDFRVSDAKGNPVPGVKVRFFGGAQILALTNRTGTPLTATDPTFYEATTDDRGLSSTDIYAQWVVPACSTVEDITVGGTVQASVGVASAAWKVSITVKKGTAAPPCS